MKSSFILPSMGVANSPGGRAGLVGSFLTPDCDITGPGAAPEGQ